jgi:hypothetical protein
VVGSVFVSQHYLQNVLAYFTLDAGAVVLPVIVLVTLVAPRCAKLVEPHRARFTLLTDSVLLLLAILWMLLLWKDGGSSRQVGLACAFIGIGVGFAVTPASSSIIGAVALRRVGTASGTADLRRDLDMPLHRDTRSHLV